MTVKTLFPNAQGMIYLLCPFCNADTTKSANLFPTNKLVRIDCPCSKSYEIIIESRKAFRKKTSLRGIFWKTKSPDVYQNVTICDLTLDGCLVLASDKHDLHQGEYIKLSFRLDDPKRTRSERDAEVRRIDKNYIGCQFVGKPAYDPDLGFFIKNIDVSK
jgi:hypothetical protein